MAMIWRISEKRIPLIKNPMLQDMEGAETPL
jgi:hypothetical protein